jgi:SAM-dependent methyltransferase
MADIDQGKLEVLLGRAIGDMGAAMSAALVRIGDELGLYRALAAAGEAGLTPAALARQTGTNERNVREWCCAQAASGYIEHRGDDSFAMTPEQRLCFADERSPACVLGGFEIVHSVHCDQPKLTDVFRSGRGFGWHEHHHGLFRGTERFFRPGYTAHLVDEWLPALDGVVERLRDGALVADVGCGHGASTILMAQAFPASRFVGFDYHAPSVERARALADEAGVTTRVRFEVARAQDFPGASYDLVAFFDCLHDMGDPVGAAGHVRAALAPDGAWLLVEPLAGDRVEDNLHPVGRLFYTASAAICTPAAMSQDGGWALGAQAGEGRLRDVLQRGGFTRVRRVAETPFNMVLEARA